MSGVNADKLPWSLGAGPGFAVERDVTDLRLCRRSTDAVITDLGHIDIP